MEDETIEDVKEAYGLLFRDMAALRVKADALHVALKVLMHEVEQSGNADARDFGWPNAVLTARTAIERYTGA